MQAPAPNLLERTIAFFAPGIARKRYHNRVWMEHERTSVSELRRTLSSVEGPKAEASGSRIDALRDGRRLAKTNEYAIGVCSSITDNIVGPKIRFESKIQTAKGSLATAKNTRVEKGFRTWAERVSIDGRRSLTETVRLLEHESLVAGECLLVRSGATDGRRVPLSIEVVESERLSDRNDPYNGNPVFNGVEFKRTGEVAAYWIHRGHPDDSGEADYRIDRIPAERVIHYFPEDRPGQVRGVSRIGPLAPSFDSLNQLMNFELAKARAGAAFALMINRGSTAKSMALPAHTGSDATDESGNTVGNIFGGMVAFGKQGDEIKGVTSTITSAFEPFARVALRRLSVGLKVSYEILTRDFSQHNFSSMKQSFLEDRRHWEASRNRLGYVLHRILRWYFDTAFISDKNAVAAVRREDLDQMTFSFQGWDWIDPAKDIKADVMAIKSGLKNVFEVGSRRGYDVSDNVQALGQLKALFEAEGLALPAEIFDAASAPDVGEDGDIDGASSSDEPSLKERMDTYGVGVRAGALTPQIADEDHFRSELGLGAPTAPIVEAWESQSQDTFEQQEGDGNEQETEAVSDEEDQDDADSEAA